MDYIDIFIKNNYINLKQIAESGQCFRWKKMCPGRYFVISDGRALVFFRKRQESEFYAEKRMRNILEDIWI